MSNTQAAGKKLAKGKSLLDKMREENSLKSIGDMNFDDFLAQAKDSGQLLDATQLGEGFHLLQGKAEKKKLEGVPLAILDYDFNPGKFGGFVTMKIKTKFPVMFDGEGYSNFIVNDGGTGIKRQLQDINEMGFDGVIVCRKGLRVSEDYEVKEDYVDENGETKQRAILDPTTGKPVLGTTFYLDTSL